MATTEPLTGITVQDQSDPAQGGLELGVLAKGLAPFGVLRFANASARDSATSSFTSGGGTMATGMLCYVASDKRYYFWTAGSPGAWAWAPWAQGQLARADYTDTTSTSSSNMTPLSPTAAALPAFNVSVPSLPAGRHLKVSFSGQLITTVAGTCYGFVLTFAGFQRRGVVHIPVASSPTSPVPQQFHISFMFDTPNATSPATGGISAGGQFSGSGQCYLVAPNNGLDNPVQFLIEDMGAV